MAILKTLTAAAVAGTALLTLATPASAVVTAFASFEPISASRNLRWANAGTGGSLYTIVPNGFSPASAQVQFSFFGALAEFVTDIDATFTLLSTAPSGNPAIRAGGLLIQNNISGSFTFTNNSELTVGDTVYAAGSNLLTGTFELATLAGQDRGSSASFNASTEAGGTVFYTSDFLNFDNTVERDFSIAITAISQRLFAQPDSALRTFRGLGTGVFSSDPAPITALVPEPEAWLLMIGGFGMIGIALRRRSRATHVTA